MPSNSNYWLLFLIYLVVKEVFISQELSHQYRIKERKSEEDDCSCASANTRPFHPPVPTLPHPKPITKKKEKKNKERKKNHYI